jgi:hypothetical protein
VIDICLVVSVKFQEIRICFDSENDAWNCVHLAEIGCLTDLSVLTFDNFNELQKIQIELKI